ncbi:preprotein translocase subunit YajC [Saccharicrinis sp. FJH54]|uniref:preprotein translocase subunit YajC n=1 Tax=Saccharicrinis sp. FJH54 TaxID=3344665 RepID=UPI0035D4F016
MTQLGIFLQTGGASGAAGNPMSGIFMMVLVFVVLYFFMIRPQMKRQKEVKKFREAMKVGDKIVTAGGLHGKIKDMKDTSVVVEIAEGVKVTVEKASVFQTGADMAQR